MNRLKFLMDASTTRCVDAAYIRDGEDLQDALQEAVLRNIDTDIEITINDTTMFLAAWLNPEHWSEDWAKKGIEADDVYDLLAKAVEDE